MDTEKQAPLAEDTQGYPLLDTIDSPEALRRLSPEQLPQLCA